jgi:hypothetical protein
MMVSRREDHGGIPEAHDVKALCGADADIAPHETAVCLVDADGSPRAIRGTIGDCLLAAQEHGVVVASVH